MSRTLKSIKIDNTAVQVESANCDGEGLNIANNYYKKSTATSSGGTKVSRAAETGNWSDLVNKPALYEHYLCLKATSPVNRSIYFKTIIKRQSAFTNISSMFTYFGGTAPVPPTPSNTHTYSSVNIPIMCSTGIIIYPDTTSDFLAEILMRCTIWCDKYYVSPRITTTTYHVTISTPIVDSGGWEELDTIEFKTIDYDRVYEI